MKSVSVFTILACTFVAQASSTANVLADISTIDTDATNLNTQIRAFPNSDGSLTAALAIHTAIGGLIIAFDTCTNDTNNITPLPVSLSDFNTITSSINTLKPNIIDLLINVVAKKSGFVSLPIGGLPALIRSDLGSLNATTQAFEDALIFKTPIGSLLATVSSWTRSINTAFATAIAAYS